MVPTVCGGKCVSKDNVAIDRTNEWQSIHYNLNIYHRGDKRGEEINRKKVKKF